MKRGLLFFFFFFCKEGSSLAGFLKPDVAVHLHGASGTGLSYSVMVLGNQSLELSITSVHTLALGFGCSPGWNILPLFPHAKGISVVSYFLQQPDEPQTQEEQES